MVRRESIMSVSLFLFIDLIIVCSKFIMLQKRVKSSYFADLQKIKIKRN